MRKYSKKFVMSLVALILALLMVCNFVGCSLDGIELSGSDDEETIDYSELLDGDDDSVFPTIEKSVITLTKTNFLLDDNDSNVTEILAEDLLGYDVNYKVDSDEGLKSYSVSDTEVIYDTSVDSYSITDAITIDDEIALEQMYYEVIGDTPMLGDVYADYFEVEVDYTDNGKVENLYYLDHYYQYEYDPDGNITYIYCDGGLLKSFAYSDGKIIQEVYTNSTEKIIYDYVYDSDEALITKNGEAIPTAQEVEDGISIDGVIYSYKNDSLSVINSEEDAEYKFDYIFDGEQYLTSKTVNGITTRYGYLGDTMVYTRRGSEEVTYILDNNLNYVGLKYKTTKYYFEVDPWGNVLALVDSDGDSVVEYEYDIWGEVISVTGQLAGSLGELNEVVNLSGLYDSFVQAYFIGSDVYFPGYGTALVDGKIVSTKCVYEWTQDSYFCRSAVTDFSKIHDKVVEVVAENLQNEGLDLATNLYAVDENGNSKRLVDIYTIDYSVTPFSAMNLVDGNQVYEVIYHSPDSMSFEQVAEQKLRTICSQLSVSYFDKYDASAGTMKFNGQFVYLGYLIDYKCDGNGIVEYQVKINKKSNYDQTVNIYDYDSGKYICYVNNTFDLDFLDGVTIIPGISQETFDVIDSYLSDYLQSVSGNICDQILIYDDPNYYNLDTLNVTSDYWSQMNLSDTTTYLEIQSDGSVQQTTMPAWQTNNFWNKIVIGLGVIVVTGVLAIAVPGGCVISSICVGAFNGAIAGALSGAAMGFVSPLIDITLEGITTGTWDFSDYFNEALQAAADGFASGAITGAIMGGIQGGLNPTYCFEAGTQVGTASGLVSIEDISVGDSVYSYNSVTGETELATVTGTSVRQTTEVVNITAGYESFVTTARHPFYVVNNDNYDGFTAAALLSVGDYIKTETGAVQITEISIETLDSPITVYNLTVEGNHSYYVGENGLLVHNGGCSNISGEGQDAIYKATKNGNLKVDAHVYTDHNLSSAARVDKITTRFSSVSKDGIDNIISMALRNPTLDKIQGTRVVIESTFSQTIGWSETGEALKTVRVVIDELGKIVSAYPI